MATGDIRRETTPTTYNPQERSFIKKPEIKICPSCGQPIQPDVKPLGNAMNKYVNAQTGKVIGVLNDDKEEITIGDTVLLREDVYNKRTNLPAPTKPENSTAILTTATVSDKTPVTVTNTTIPTIPTK